jgi:large conductance mechanosensitive channel
MIKEFKAFALRGNVVDLAVGVVVGSSFSAIVTSLVGDIIMPVIGILTGGKDFSGLTYTLGNSTINYGKFIQATFVFLIVAFTLFAVVKVMSRLHRKNDAIELVTPPPETKDIVLLTEIRDLLMASPRGRE